MKSPVVYPFTINYNFLVRNLCYAALKGRLVLKLADLKLIMRQ